MDFSFLAKYWPFFVQGIGITLLLAVFTVLFGTILGALFGMMRLSKSKLVKAIAWIYVEFIRGTPLLVQIFIVFYALPQIGIQMPQIPWLSDDFPRFFAGIIALSINSGAYVAEIFRAGIQAVDKGQSEAAWSLGMKQPRTMMSIILPQAVRNILPALGNEFVTVIKESSLVSVIGIAELMYKTNIVKSNTYNFFGTLIFCALLYFMMTFITSRLVNLLERRLHSGERK